jgi:hypothetical protein
VGYFCNPVVASDIPLALQLLCHIVVHLSSCPKVRFCYVLQCYFVTVLGGFVTWVCNIINGSSKGVVGLFCMYCYNVTEYNII